MNEEITSCKKHGCQIQHAKVKISGSEQIIEICPECEREEIMKMESVLRQEAKIQALLSHTYKVFDRESIYSQELSDKTLENYVADNSTNEQALNFMKRMLRDYLKFETGNVILSGPPGIGKSHLSIGLAKALNEQSKE